MCSLHKHLLMKLLGSDVLLTFYCVRYTGKILVRPIRIVFLQSCSTHRIHCSQRPPPSEEWRGLSEGCWGGAF